MTKANLQSALTGIIDNPNDVGLQLLFVYKDGDQFSVSEPALDNDVLEPALKTDFLKEIREQLVETNEDWDYSFDSLNTAEASDIRRVYHITADEIPIAKSLFEEIKNVYGITDFDPKAHSLTEIWAVIIKIANADKTIYLFKKNYPINVIKQGKIYPVFFTNGALQLEQRDLLKISKYFDFLYLDGNLIILEKDDFEKSFDYVAAMEKKANASIDLILKANLLEDASKIYSLSLKRNQVKKIISIRADNPVLKKSPRQIVNFAKKYGMEISLSDDKTRLHLKNQQEAKALLKIFNDDYLLSEMTQTRYDSKGKLKVESLVTAKK